MLPTFVIGLREGVEASLIVGIIAAFLRQEGRRDMLRSVWVGVGLAAAICLAVGIALDVLNGELPQRQQEMLETVVSVLAVGVVSFMILWMTRHARGLRKELEAGAASALATGSAAALVGMAFFAVLREGLETAVFLLAIFQDASDPSAAGIGAVLGIAVAVLIGFGIYRGGVRLNLARFFRLTSVVLVVVAAGLLASAAGTAWEAGWITSFQSQPLDLSWLVVPGTWTSSLLTGMLGLEPHPSVAQIAVYLAYAVPMGLYVLWPRGRSLRRARGQSAGTVGARTTA
jgi:high-affinity iron transporter